MYEDIDDALKMVNANDIEQKFCISLRLKKMEEKKLTQTTKDK